MGAKKDKSLVLIVDDEPEIRDLYITILRQNPDLYFIEASNGHEALALIKKNAYMFRPNNIKCVVLDLKMPVMGGADMLQCFEGASFFRRDLPFIICSAYSMDEMKSETAAIESVNIVEYFNKPVNIAKFREVIHQVTSAQKVRL